VIDVDCIVVDEYRQLPMFDPGEKNPFSSIAFRLLASQQAERKDLPTTSFFSTHSSTMADL
jgi:hypothetical protein